MASTSTCSYTDRACPATTHKHRYIDTCLCVCVCVCVYIYIYESGWLPLQHVLTATRHVRLQHINIDIYI